MQNENPKNMSKNISENIKILALAGSLRSDSYNKKLIKIAVKGAEAAGAQVSLIDLRDFAMPIYDGDLEDQEGLPASAIALKKLMMAYQGLLIASPEYNSSISGALKNMIDWISRPMDGQEGLEPFENKVATLMSASTGGLGGLRGLVHVRSILGNIGVTVLPDQIAIPKAHDAFSHEGTLINVKLHAKVENLGVGLVRFLVILAKGRAASENLS